MARELETGKGESKGQGRKRGERSMKDQSINDPTLNGFDNFINQYSSTGSSGFGNFSIELTIAAILKVRYLVQKSA